jgi:hypothetical protein
MRWLLGLVLILVALFFLATDTQPSLKRSALIDSLGLRRMREGETRQLVVSETDLDRGMNALAARLGKGSASTKIASDQLIVHASLSLPVVGRFVNLELTLAQAGEVLAPARMRLGSLPVPAALSGEMLAGILALSPYANELAAARDMLDSARLRGGNLALRFTWRGAAVERAMAGTVGQGVDNRVLDVYRAHLNQVGGGDFAVLLGEAFALAKRRSGDHDPILENRAALTVLAENALGGKLLSRRGAVNLERRSGIRLAGRGDFSQHFALSAFIAATGGEGLSDMAGLYKEIKDSQGGSGFSFTDLAADRAGSRLGETSTRSKAFAKEIQHRLAGTRNSALFFPAVKDLPEFMNQAEFQRRFGGVDEPAYQAMMEKIEGRIEGLAVYAD